MKLRLSCQEVSRLLSVQQEDDLPAPERARLRLHMVICHVGRWGRRKYTTPPPVAAYTAGSKAHASPNDTIRYLLRLLAVEKRILGAKPAC